LELADDVGPLLHERLAEGEPNWWAWRRLRNHAATACWLVSPRGFTITPWVPPSWRIPHFREPERRLYLSATIGDPEDLRRRIG
ncbi:hypothetical protein, partial [Gordonia paraffinivorans]|uniref:hypothetical protein n=1 Tax=Gordonia paraffinivorans TaxID=175628 RepID=UPI001445DB74